MKKTLLIITLFCFSLSTSIYAACTPDGSVTGTGIHPMVVSLDTGYVGGNYSQTLTVVVPGDTTYQGFTVTVNTATVSGITGLPGTLSYSCTPTGCVFPGGASYCILIEGSPTATYSDSVIISLSVEVETMLGPIVIPQDLTYTYALEVVDTSGGGGACTIAVMTSSTEESTPGDSNGTATITVTAGVGPYVYLWSDGQTTSTASGLASAAYTFTVWDADTSCNATGTVIVYAGTNGISANGGSKFEVYPITPNPSRDQAEIRFSSPDYRNVSLSVHNMIGATVLSKKIYAEQGLNIVPFSSKELNPGVYFITLTDGTISSTKRMVVTR